MFVYEKAVAVVWVISSDDTSSGVYTRNMHYNVI